ncbi:hypothetical protein [Nocardia wallacei]|uniref:hypothetical protein n=1 Tax=Nocardia wallacei TaxID=480035 RepID=UPI0024548DC7|nr:hypothetical protein [Nocardia wallacei]
MSLRKLIATVALPLAIGVALAGPANSAPTPEEDAVLVAAPPKPAPPKAPRPAPGRPKAPRTAPRSPNSPPAKPAPSQQPTVAPTPSQPPRATSTPPRPPNSQYHARVECPLFEQGKPKGVVTGSGSGHTKPAAIDAAERDAQRNVPDYHYKGACREI